MSEFPLPANLAASDALDTILVSIWQHLAEAVRESRAGWRLPVLGTSAGTRCEQRTVVLRRVQTNSAAFLFHTDVRSAKVDQVRRQPEVSLLFYDHGLAAQLKVCGVASTHTADDLADDVWRSGFPLSLQNYQSPVPPGDRIRIPDVLLSHPQPQRIPERDEIESGRPNFCVIRVQTTSLEWLRLRPEGNLRAIFEYHDGHCTDRAWLAP